MPSVVFSGEWFPATYTRLFCVSEPNKLVEYLLQFPPILAHAFNILAHPLNFPFRFLSLGYTPPFDEALRFSASGLQARVSRSKWGFANFTTFHIAVDSMRSRNFITESGNRLTCFEAVRQRSDTRPIILHVPFFAWNNTRLVLTISKEPSEFL